MRGSTRGSGAAPGEGAGAADGRPANSVNERRPTADVTAIDPLGAAADDAATTDAVAVLLERLSRLRLSLSADLSAAAGALDAERPDVAADALGGARADVADWLRDLEQPPASPWEGRASSAPSAPQVPTQRGTQSRVTRRLGKALRVFAGAAALAAAFTLVPQLTSRGGPQHNSAASAPLNVRLVSDRLADLRTQLQAPDANPQAILRAGRSWQDALAGSIPRAAGDATAAQQVLLLLRAEKTLLSQPAARRSVALASATATLENACDLTFTRLRATAVSSVRAILPAVLTALPIDLAPPVTPKPIATALAAPARPTAPATGVTAAVAPAPTPNPPVTPPSGTGQAPVPAPAAATPPSPAGVPAPVQSLLNQVAGAGSAADGVQQTVTGVLNGLGIGP